jgi:hypothetical protein
MKIAIMILTAAFLWGCMSSPDKKIFIKSIPVDDGKRVDWYSYNAIGGFAKSYLQYEDKTGQQHTFLESAYLSDVTKQGDTLIIQVWKSDGNDYQLDYDEAQALGLVTRLDTTGKQWNGVESRLDRLQKKHIDVEKFHFTESSCPNGECN